VNLLLLRLAIVSRMPTPKSAWKQARISSPVSKTRSRTFSADEDDHKPVVSSLSNDTATHATRRRRAESERGGLDVSFRMKSTDLPLPGMYSMPEDSS